MLQTTKIHGTASLLQQLASLLEQGGLNRLAIEDTDKLSNQGVFQFSPEELSPGKLYDASVARLLAAVEPFLGYSGVQIQTQALLGTLKRAEMEMFVVEIAKRALDLDETIGKCPSNGQNLGHPESSIATIAIGEFAGGIGVTADVLLHEFQAITGKVLHDEVTAKWHELAENKANEDSARLTVDIRQQLMVLSLCESEKVTKSSKDSEDLFALWEESHRLLNAISANKLDGNSWSDFIRLLEKLNIDYKFKFPLTTKVARLQALKEALDTALEN